MDERIHTVPDDARIRQRVMNAVSTVRESTPLAQSFTNFVTINLVANAQLAAGGTAAMSYLPDDIIDTAQVARASYINVGTLLPFYADALDQITAYFHTASHPWVLDPVAAGIGSTRTRILSSFRENPPTVVRANASEVIALASIWGLDVPSTTPAADDASTDDSEADTADDAPAAPTKPAGVEAVDDVDSSQAAAIAIARFLRATAPNHRAAVAVSGPVDLITDGDQVFRLFGGDAMMTKITGAGCALGGVTATYLAVCDPLVAALSAGLLFNRASEAAATSSSGPGSFQTAFLDALWNAGARDVAMGTMTATSAQQNHPVVETVL